MTDGKPEKLDGHGSWNELVIDLPDEELVHIERRAHANGQSVEQWARAAIRTYLGLP